MTSALRRHAQHVSTREDLQAFELRALQDLESQPHAPSCVSRAERAGEDGWDYGYSDACSCQLNDDIDRAGGRTRR